MTLAEQLTDLYQNETWHRNRLPDEEATRYHQWMLDHGNIITVSDGEVLAGYVEFWRVTHEQLFRIVHTELFKPFDEDLTHGYFCYVANLYVKEPYRKGQTIKFLKKRLFEVCKDCHYYVGERHKQGKEILEIRRR